MNRRGFLTSLVAFSATAMLDPERALWVPGAKTISIPKTLGLRQIEALGTLKALENYNAVIALSVLRQYVFTYSNNEIEIFPKCESEAEAKHIREMANYVDREFFAKPTATVTI